MPLKKISGTSLWIALDVYKRQIVGGETVVKVSGQGKGGRNQEIALSAADGIRNLENVVVFSISSDGTDGPTDAAGGIVNGKTAEELEALGIKCEEVLKNNDSYHALEKIDVYKRQHLLELGIPGCPVRYSHGCIRCQVRYQDVYKRQPPGSRCIYRSCIFT